MTLPASEQGRRAAALERLVGELELDALVLAGSRLPRPQGHAALGRRLQPRAPLRVRDRRAGTARPSCSCRRTSAQARPGGWDVPVAFARDLRIGLPEALRAIGPMRRIGVVGLGQVMKVEDYLALRDGLPRGRDRRRERRLRARSARTRCPRRSRACASRPRSPTRCFDRLLEVARIGITEREIGAAMYERCYALGGEDPLFLSMYPERRDGRAEGRFGPPVDRVLERGEQLVFSFELVGRIGYWMEFARMVVFGEPTDAAGAHERRGDRRPRGRRRADAAGQAARRGAGARSLDAVATHGADCSYWSGHGIGQDVIEEPWLGLEMVQDRARALALGARRRHGAREPPLRRRPRRRGRRLHGRHVPRHARRAARPSRRSR